MTSLEQKTGVFYGLMAFVFWGLVPIYFKAVGHVHPMEILCHRIIWSVPLTALLVTFFRDWKNLREALRSGKVIGTLFLSATLVAVNWFVFIWAVNTGQVLQGSLGYFINPLVNVLLGMIFLRERIGTWQILAVLLAAAGTLNLTLNFGKLPWIALTLAFSFGFYALLRKTVQIESVNGLFVETGLLFPFAFGYLVLLGVKGTVSFGTIDSWTTTLLVLAGFVTSLPLLAFTSAARRLQLTTMGILQYIAPSTYFFMAVFYYQEPFTVAHLVSFGFIWTGLAIFMADSIYLHRRSEPIERMGTSS